jgi:MoxR-vWA-beta-propeller ternary system domain bpX5
MHTKYQPSLPLDWIVREPPLEAAGLVAQGILQAPVARAIQEHFARCVEQQTLTALRICHGNDWLAVLGPVNELPWVDGVSYVGWDRNLLMLTTLRPSLPTFLVERAIQLQVRSATHPITIVLPGRILLCEPSTRPIDGQRLRDLAQS